MRWIIALSLLVILQSQGCKKQQTIRVPACIQEKIDAIRKQPRYNPPATVYRYSYLGKDVYLFSSDCCDQYNYAFDKDCNVVCAPSGGISGRGDGRCPNFKQMASGETLIWKDER